MAPPRLRAPRITATPGSLTAADDQQDDERDPDPAPTKLAGARLRQKSGFARERS